MDIAPISATTATSPIDRFTAQQHAAAEKAKQQAQDALKVTPREPVPAIRPTIQDQIDITRALLVIRNAS